MFHLICIFVSVGAALMPDTALPNMLDLLAAGLALVAVLTVSIFDDAVKQAVKRQLAPPDPRVFYPAWAIILIATSAVHWFPLCCFTLTFVIESAFYAQVRRAE